VSVGGAPNVQTEVPAVAGAVTTSDDRYETERQKITRYRRSNPRIVHAVGSRGLRDG